MRRIFANAAATYLRSLVSLALGLFAIRWVLAALGPSDYGLYAVIASMIACTAFVNVVLANATSRCYAFALGANRPGEHMVPEAVLKDWFNTALLVHLALALLLLALGWPLGEWVVRHFVKMPEGRLSACLAAFRFALAAALVQMLYIPFQAMYTARQRIAQLAAFGILMNALGFAGAWTLLHLDGDLLVWHAGISAAVMSGVPLLASVCAVRRFPCCRFALRTGCHRGRAGELLRFVGWTLFGTFGWMLANNGGAIVTNRFFGSTANAAYGVSQQVQNQADALSLSLVGAFSPEVSAREGSGDRARVVQLSLVCGRLGYLLFALLAVPLALELETVLGLWLGTPPADAATVCTVLLAACAVNRLTMGTQLALNASGRIARWQIVGGLALLCTVPVAVVLAAWGLGVTSAAAAFLSMSVVASGVCAWQGARQAGVPLAGWAREVLLPASLSTVVAVAAGFCVTRTLAPSFGRVCLTSLVTSLMFAWPILRAVVGGFRTA